MDIKKRSRGEIKLAIHRLTKARDILAKTWVHRGPSEDNEHCALTAINEISCRGKTYNIEGKLEDCVVLHEANKFYARRRATKDQLMEYGEDFFYTVPDWNDGGATKREVRQVFKNAIKRLIRALPEDQQKQYKI